MELWTAFTIGIFGSLHCVGMCGPIAIALPYQGQQKWRAAGNVLTYNIGRVVTYSLLGAFIGLIGKGLFITGLQTYFSIGIGILLLVIAAFSINVESKLVKIPVISRVNIWVKRQLGYFLRSNTAGAMFTIGLLNGLLPCGLVYMAVVGAVSTGTVWNGMLYMALFGLGTIPLMLATSVAGQFVNLQWRNRLRKLIPVFLVGFAILFIFRGLNFHIPPGFSFWENMHDIPMCH